VRLSARTNRSDLLRRLLGAGLLASVLPTLLLTPLQAEVILLHSDCERGTHAHRLDAVDLENWQAQHAREDPCCGSGEEEGVAGAHGSAAADCDHNQPPVIIAKGPFLAIRAGQPASAHLPRALHAVGPAVVGCDPVVACATRIPVSSAAGPPRAPDDGTAMILSRNHALLL
jgi:hypothetical protein